MTLRNPRESLDNVEYSERRVEHSSRIGDLLAPRSDWNDRESVKRAIEKRRNA